jgi:trehalose-6-phosphate synthase
MKQTKRSAVPAPNSSPVVVAQSSPPDQAREPQHSCTQDAKPNPALQAALKRQQQNHGTVQHSSAEKTERQQLLESISAVLRRKGEDEPFGLRSMDTTKLRLYLNHITSEASAK